MKNAPNNAHSGEIVPGTVFGDLKLVEVVRVGRFDSKHWKCSCLCGKEAVFTERKLLGGSIKTCGAHPSRGQLQNNANARARLTKYPDGFGSRSRLHSVWCNMKSRCTNPNSTKYADYGARGIRVCGEWASYGNFLDWSLANGYQSDLTLDRKDNYAGYSPDNCRWVTTTVQQRNKRKPRLDLTIHGETKTVADWAKDPRCEVTYSALTSRIRDGFPPELCLLGLPTGRPPGGRLEALRGRVGDE